MTMPKRSGQKGMALFFALIFILILSVLGVSIMFVSQAETWSSLITDSGGAAIYYDLPLGSPSSSSPIATVQEFMMDSFSWARF
jgi:hypothetical protein